MNLQLYMNNLALGTVNQANFFLQLFLTLGPFRGLTITEVWIDIEIQTFGPKLQCSQQPETHLTFKLKPSENYS